MATKTKSRKSQQPKNRYIANSDSGVRVPTAGWFLLSPEQLTHKENSFFRNAKPVSWPFAVMALFYVPENEQKHLQAK